MNRILIADPLQPIGLEMFRRAGADVTILESQDRERLPEMLPDFDALVVRSATRVTAELLDAGKRLRVVGRAGIGVDNVDVAAATERGILVVNAPTANSLSATEHTWALLLALARRVAEADLSMKQERWDRKAFVGYELAGKTLGVIGFGRIGQQVGMRARAFDMKVVAFDPFLDASVAERLDVELMAVDEVLQRADVVTLHTPLTDSTRGLLSAERLALMKQGSLLVNCARGGLVDEAALLRLLEEGRLAGAAFDVFEEEPPTSWALAKHPRVVATPHIGAQTREAQERIATQTARMVLDALEGSLAVTAVNLPFSSTGSRGEPYLDLGDRLGRLAVNLFDDTVQEVRVDLWGIDESLHIPISVAVLRGVLGPMLGEGVNFVNAERIAAARGVELVRVAHSRPADWTHLVEVRLKGGRQQLDLAGTLYQGRDPRVVRQGEFPLEFSPAGKLLVLRNEDVPGVVGKLGQLLGDARINIVDIHLARHPREEIALAVLRLDQEPSDEVLASLVSHPEVREARTVDMGNA